MNSQKYKLTNEVTDVNKTNEIIKGVLFNLIQGPYMIKLFNNIINI